MDHVERNLTIHERNRYKDLVLRPLVGRWEFGLRFLNQIKRAMANFDFQYLLRIDDDYFLCLKRLLSELPMRAKQHLVWGNFHCEVGITWIDESFMVHYGYHLSSKGSWSGVVGLVLMRGSGLVESR